MLQVHIRDSRDYTATDKNIVKLPHYKCLVFDLNTDYFISEITADLYVSKEFIDFIVCCDKYDDILNSSIKKGLTTLTYIMYMTADSLQEIVKRLNSLELEEVIWCMVCDKVLDEFRALYEKTKKDELD